ncbi:hypothetical protein JW758_01380 [Candidatus Peregrinibacteria bacterium]|nr:hypothetical protein [Candidatus Peregrinibacteria bacterium]
MFADIQPILKGDSKQHFFDQLVRKVLEMKTCLFVFRTSNRKDAKVVFVITDSSQEEVLAVHKCDIPEAEKLFERRIVSSQGTDSRMTISNTNVPLLLQVTIFNGEEGHGHLISSIELMKFFPFRYKSEMVAKYVR